MAKQSAAKPAADNPARGVHAASTSPATRAVKRAEARAPQAAKDSLARRTGEGRGEGRPSSLLDTRVVYCGDNLEQLAKLRSLGRREPLYAKTGYSK